MTTNFDDLEPTQSEEYREEIVNDIMFVQRPKKTKREELMNNQWKRSSDSRTTPKGTFSSKKTSNDTEV